MKGLAKLIREHRFIVTVDGKHLINLDAKTVTLMTVANGSVNETHLELTTQRLTMDEKYFLRWLYARLINVYREKPNVDFALKLKSLSE